MARETLANNVGGRSGFPVPPSKEARVSLVPRSFLVLLGLTACSIAGCGGTENVTPAQPSTVPLRDTARQATATLRITVPTPAPLPLGANRSPRYLSPATKAIAIAFTSTTIASPPTLSFNQNLTVGSTGCTANVTTQLVCNITFSLPADSYTGTISTYDQQLSGTTLQGNLLSSRQAFPVTIAANTANAINVVLGGVPAGALFAPATSSTLTGGPIAFSVYQNAGPQKVTLVATDINGNIIVGPGSPTIALSASDANFLASVIDATLNPNAFTLTVAGPNPGTISLTATITPAAGGGTAIVRSFPITVAVPPGVATLAGSLTSASGLQNGIGTAALFRNPRGIARTASGNFIVADTFNSVYRQVTPGGIVTTFAGNGTAASVNASSFAAAGFSNPSGVAIDAAGNVYTSEVNSNIIRKLDTTGVVSNFATFGTNIGAIAIDTGGNLYAPDTGIGGLWKVTTAGVVTQLVANSTFTTPIGVAVDSANGYVYVGDAGNNRIARVPTTGGTVTTFVGGGAATAVDGATGTSTCGAVYGMTVANDQLYFTDYTNSLVRRTTLTGGNSGLTKTIAGAGFAGNTDSVVALSASLNHPFDLAFGADGTTLYVTDYNGQNIRTVSRADL